MVLIRKSALVLSHSWWNGVVCKSKIFTRIKWMTAITGFYSKIMDGAAWWRVNKSQEKFGCQQLCIALYFSGISGIDILANVIISLVILTIIPCDRYNRLHCIELRWDWMQNVKFAHNILIAKVQDAEILLCHEFISQKIKPKFWTGVLIFSRCLLWRDLPFYSSNNVYKDKER